MSTYNDQQSIRFDGQVIVVTGAGRGLGAAYARLIAARGGAVIVHDAGVAQDGSGFDPSVADAVVAEITAAGGTAAACYENLEDALAAGRVVEFAVARFGRLDVLILNAGTRRFRKSGGNRSCRLGSHDLHRRRRSISSRSRCRSAHAPTTLWAHRPHHIRPSHATRACRTRTCRVLRSQDGAGGSHGRSRRRTERHEHLRQCHITCGSDPRATPECAGAEA